MTTECPNCHMDNAYCDGVQYVCPDCDFEWPCDEIDWAENEQEEIDEDDDY
ncbi:MAG: hypothetical protein J5524_08755 [Bacteroidaceae bacterium]|nr:hypothetical protein [Bacteroidaceae bacterium]MBO4841172.1 hypothetical protein [Bacteroidaceae bacterium]